MIAREYKASVAMAYGGELVEVILFGSYARGDYHSESDIDFAVVLRNPDMRPAAELRRLSPIGSRLSLKYGIMVSSIPVSLEKKQNSMQGIHQEIRRKGVPYMTESFQEEWQKALEKAGMRWKMRPTISKADLP